MTRMKSVLIIGCLAILAIATSVAMASGANSGSPLPKALGHRHAPGEALSRTGATKSLPVRHTINRSLVKHFAVLRRATRPSAWTAGASSENIVATAVGYLSALNKSYGADASQAAETTIGPGHVDVWMVPGGTGACLVDLEGPQGAGSTCNGAAAVDAGELWTLDTIPYGASGAMTRVLLGLAPDGNSSVTVSWAGGGSTVVPVSNNVYSVPIGSHAGWTSVSLKNGAGDLQAVPGMPSLP